MQRIFTGLLLIICFFVFIAYFYFNWIASNLARDSENSSQAYFFATLGNRAIQLDRLGKMGWSALKVDNSIPSEIWTNVSNLNCNSEIEVKPVNPLEQDSVSVRVERSYPFVVYLIYSGPPPDFSPFLEAENSRYLFGPQQTFYKAQKGNSVLNEALNAHDFRLDYDKYVKNNKFSWASVVCESFTFTILKEL